MDKISKDILNLIQSNFPIEPRPFLTIANALNLSEEQVINIVKDLKEKKLIKRIGGILESGKLGYHSMLCALQVPTDRINEVAGLINSNAGVTHNYIRNHSYNMWFTVIAPTMVDIKQFLSDIKLKTGIDYIIELPVIKLFKISAVFDIKE